MNKDSIPKHNSKLVPWEFSLCGAQPEGHMRVTQCDICGAAVKHLPHFQFGMAPEKLNHRVADARLEAKAYNGEHEVSFHGKKHVKLLPLVVWTHKGDEEEHPVICQSCLLEMAGELHKEVARLSG